jgi:hypothetical protein
MKGDPWPLATVAVTATAAVVAAADAFQGLAPVGASPSLPLDVEADVQHVAVLDDVVLALEPLLSPLHDLRA